jgi:hypothetical protein
MLTVLVPPSILAQPRSLTVTNGGEASFSVTAAGTPPLRYQWKLQGMVLSAPTSSTLVVTNAQTADAGDYTVEVSNDAGTVTSAAAHLTVQVPSLGDLTLANPQWVNGRLEFDVTGPIQSNCIIWSSASLADWVAIQTNFTADGVVHFSDPTSPAGVANFYRATVGP